MKKWIGLAVGAVMAGVLTAGATPETDAAAAQKAMEAMMKAMAGSGAGAPAAALVDFRMLKTLLPETLAGMKRTSASGEKNGAAGMFVAEATGEYSGENGASLSLKITDMGGLGGLGAMAQAGWAMQEIDKETDNGYERTFDQKGFKAKESYDKLNKSGEVQSWVASRFLVEIKGNGVKDGDLRKALDGVDLARLSTLKPAGAGAAK